MADFTELLTPTDQVLSVNGNTGAITAAQIAAAVEAATDSNTLQTQTIQTNAIESGATADQTATEIKQHTKVIAIQMLLRMQSKQIIRY